MTIKPNKKRQLLHRNQPDIVEDLMATTGWPRERVEAALADLQVHGLLRVQGNKVYLKEVI